MERVLQPLDALRRGLWRLSLKTGLGRAALRDRALRLNLLALGHIAVAAILTFVAPLWLLLLGPLVLGVPHVVGDVRYLVIRPPRGVSRRSVQIVLVALTGMTVLRGAAVIGAPYALDWELVLGGVAVVGAIAAAPGHRGRRLLLAAVACGLVGVGLTSPYEAALALGHLHNVVAFGLWLWLVRRDGRRRGLILVVGAYVLVCGLILGGAFDGAAVSLGAAGLDIDRAAYGLAPGASGVWALRWVLLFAFAQAIHYAIWVRLLPHRLNGRHTPPTFRWSWRRLRQDITRTGLALVVVASVALPLIALASDALATRDAYLALVLFHGWLEIAVIAALLAGRGADPRGELQVGL